MKQTVKQSIALTIFIAQICCCDLLWAMGSKLSTLNGTFFCKNPTPVVETKTTALIQAAKKGHTKTVQALLTTDIDINQTDQNSATALIWAAKHGHIKIVRALLTQNVDANRTDNFGYTSLIWAAINGHEAIVKALLAHGVNIDATTQSGYTALMWAAINGDIGTAKALLNNGTTNIDATNHQFGNTALILATQGNREDLIEALLDHGADIHVVNYHGKTALTYAKENRSCRTLALLENAQRRMG